MTSGDYAMAERGLARVEALIEVALTANGSVAVEMAAKSARFGLAEIRAALDGEHCPEGEPTP